MSEAKLQRAIQRQLRQDHGCFVIKNHGNAFSMAGVPDLTVIQPAPPVQIDTGVMTVEIVKAVNFKAKYGDARTIWIEVKLPGKKLSKVQEKVIELMRKHGAEVHVVDTVQKAIEVVNGRSGIKSDAGSTVSRDDLR